MPLEPGARAPAIRAHTHRGEDVHVPFEEPAVLYFYPRDDTPGCTIEAKQFERMRSRFERHDISIYGVSTDDVATHAAFADEYDLGFALLADPDGEIARAFDVEVTKNQTARTTFVIENGTIEKVYEDVDPDGHAKTVVADLIEAGIIKE